VREGYVVDVVRSGDDALSRTGAHEYDAVVLDLMLPGMDGVSVCRALRRSERWVPVLILTARSEVRDRIRGLDAGADDYLVKPFDFGELLARLRALTRRAPYEPAAILEVGDLRVDRVARLATRAGAQVELTARELAVLELLAHNAGQVVSRSQLHEHVWSGKRDSSPNVVNVYIGYLRKKLEQPSGRPLIRTVRGAGFVLEPW
jgi:DNA-binding response OmpR family regulator